jgi:hypothetical protein
VGRRGQRLSGRHYAAGVEVDRIRESSSDLQGPQPSHQTRSSDADRCCQQGINASIYGIGNTLGPLIDLIPFPGTTPSHINYVVPFAITMSINWLMFLIAACFLVETLPREHRVPFTFTSLNR